MGGSRARASPRVRICRTVAFSTEKPRFQYRLEPRAKGWNNLDRQRSAFLRGLHRVISAIRSANGRSRGHVRSGSRSSLNLDSTRASCRGIRPRAHRLLRGGHSPHRIRYGLYTQIAQAIHSASTRSKASVEPARFTGHAASENLDIRRESSQRSIRGRSEEHERGRADRAGHMGESAVVAYDCASRGHEFGGLPQREFANVGSDVRRKR